jgi:CRP/FNR family transcriptional regulator, cyclic AMP receptor protein
MGPNLDGLAAHPLFRGVTSDRIEACARSIKVRTVPRGALLNGPATSPGRLQLVLEGTLRTYQIQEDGRELLFDLIPAGGFDGALSVSGHRPHFTEAHVNSTVAEIDSTTLEDLIACDAKIAANLFELVMDRLESRERQLEAVAIHDPDQQIARQLLALAHTFGRRQSDRVVLDSRITHQMLADMLGVRRETVTLHLIRLTQRGILSVVRGRFEFDVAALSGVARSRRPVRRSA